MTISNKSRREMKQKNSIRKYVCLKKFYGNCDRKINKEYKGKWDK